MHQQFVMAIIPGIFAEAANRQGPGMRPWKATPALKM
jgi:hypothetical protein